MSEEQAFVSGLKEGRQRLVSAVLVHGHNTGVREAPDFIRHFPPARIMEGLRSRPDLRAKILVPCTGTHEKIGLKMDSALAAVSLQIALDEHVSEPENVLMAFDPDDRVTYLDAPALYTYATESAFWNESDVQVETERHREHVRFWLDCALAEKLVTHREIVEGVTVETLVACLPKEEVVKVLTATLAAAKDGKAYDEESFLATCPNKVLVAHVPLKHIWEKVVVPHIAERHGFVKEDEPAVEEEPPAVVRAAEEEPPAASVVVSYMEVEAIGDEVEEEYSPKADEASSSVAKEQDAVTPAEIPPETERGQADAPSPESFALSVRESDLIPSTVQTAEEKALIKSLCKTWKLNQSNLQDRALPVLQNLANMLSSGELTADQSARREAIIAFLMAATSKGSEHGLRKLPSKALQELFIKTVGSRNNELAQDLLTSE